MSYAQVAAFDFQGLTGTETSDNADVVDAEITSPVTITKVGVTPASNGGRFTSSNWPIVATIDLNKYIEFTLTPIANAVVSVSSINMIHRRSGTGPLIFELRSSIDGYMSSIGGIITIASAATTSNQTSNFTSLSATPAIPFL